ncbi:hypothetical protein [Arthrobacter sp. UYCo732]|uniref:hypothetical protein n=1 Tax=Arthrobacter sp. UYCo732 TaxID=3156336 RepID=UPI0033980044
MTIRSTPTAKAAVAAGTFLLASVLLTGCGSEKHTFSGVEVSKLDKTIESLDAAWAEYRANGTAATVIDDSRCFVQKAPEGVLGDTALCGPVHYLGQDETTWDAVKLSGSPEGADKILLGSGKSFSTGQPGANTSLYRTDGKKASDKTDLPEPDTTSAPVTQAIWGTGSGPSGTTVKVETPDGVLSVNGIRISDRIGGVSNRLKAGDGNKFGTASLNFTPTQTPGPGYLKGPEQKIKTTLAFISGDKTYPVGDVKSGTVSMPVPGDGKDLALAITYEGLTQTVTLGDSKLHTTATAYYDGVVDTAKGTTPAELEIGDHTKDGMYARFSSDSVTATRTAYDAKTGWAPEGKAWLVVNGSARASSTKFFGLSQSFYDGRSKANSYYDTALNVASASASNVSGEKFTVEAKSMENEKATTSNGTATFKIVFEVPATATDFTVDYTVHSAGTLQRSSDKGAPATSSMDYPVKGVQLTFPKE